MYRRNEAATDLSGRLARHAISLDAARLPATTIHATKRAILDGIGVMLAASGESADIRPFLEMVRAEPGPPHAMLQGFADRTSTAHAALVNGAMAHALDFEDAFDPVPLHPNASLLPAALASVERSPRSGSEFIAAVALGCDLVCRLGLSLRHSLDAGGWYPPPILGAFGATLAAARISGLTAEQLCDAWSLLLGQNSCPGEIKHSAHGTLRAVREAFPAHAAVLSVQLAARGVRGFDTPFEGKSAFFELFARGDYDTAPLLDALGEQFWIEQLSFKRWPCCRGTHAYIEAVQVLRRDHPWDAADIEAIVCVGGKVQQMLAEPALRKTRPQTLIDAKFSIPFTVAVAIARQNPTLGSFTVSALTDPELLKFAAMCEFRCDPTWGGDRAAAGELTLRLRDGRTLTHSIPRAMGEPSRPLSDEALRAKFIDCASRAAKPVERSRAERYADRILALECEADAAAAFRSVRDAP